MKAEYHTKYMAFSGGYFDEGINKKPMVRDCGHDVSSSGIFAFEGLASVWEKGKTGECMSESTLNTIFEQDGKVYAICSHDVPTGDLSRFISSELRYMNKIPRAQMRVVTTEEFRTMSFSKPSKV